MTKKQLQEIENIINIASEDNLSAVMNRALTFALSTENHEFSYWIECELSGYLEGNQTFIDNRSVTPDYRKIVGIYMDSQGKSIHQYYRDLDFVNFYYLREGVGTLENLSTIDGTIEIQKADAFKDLSKQFSIPITKFRFEPLAVISVLQAIRQKLIKQLVQIKNQYKNEIGFLSRNDSLKFIQSYHPTVQKIAMPYFEDEYYRSAVLDTYIGLIQTIKDKSKVMDKDGSQLMDYVFSPNRPILKVSDDKDEQQGAMWLFKGAVMYIRNANAHKIIEWDDAQRAIEWLAVASGLFHIVQESQEVGYN